MWRILPKLLKGVEQLELNSFRAEVRLLKVAIHDLRSGVAELIPSVLEEFDPRSPGKLPPGFPAGTLRIRNISNN